MRLAYCYVCSTLSRLDDYEGDYLEDGEPISDHLLENWIKRHMHGLSEDVHPGGRIFPFEGHDIEVHDGRLDGVRVDVTNEVDEVRKELALAGREVHELRDELKEDALSCHSKHGRPTWPDKKCIDYHDDSKWLGKKVRAEGQRLNVQQGYLCSMCPYETAVSIARRGF